MTKPIDRGPGVASPVPWKRWLAWGEPNNGAEDHAGNLIFVGRKVTEQDAAAIVHRVNNWDALCDRLEAAEAEVGRLKQAFDGATGRLREVLKERDAAERLAVELWDMHGGAVDELDADRDAELCEQIEAMRERQE